MQLYVLTIVYILFKLNGPVAKSEEGDSSEAEKAIHLPRLDPPYAQIPSSAPRKLKTLYEALASEQSTIREEQEEELYGSSPGSPSPKSSSSGGSMKLFSRLIQNMQCRQT